MSDQTHPLVSVIIPAFQSANTLPRALKSVLLQDYSNLEIIVVDDHSTDRTKVVLQEYFLGDPRIRYIYLNKNCGPARARNIGVAFSHGEYLAFLDADDAWVPGKLTKQIDFLQKKPEVGIIFTDCTNIRISDNARNKLSRINGDFLQRLILCKASTNNEFFLLNGPVQEELFRKFFILISSVAMKRSVFEIINGFDPRRLGTEDVDFFVRLSIHTKISYWNREMVLRYQSDESISSVSEKWLTELLNYYCTCLDMEEYKSLRHLTIINLRKTYQGLIGYYGLENDRKKIAEAFRSSLQYGFSLKVFIYSLLCCCGSSLLKFVRQIYLWKK